MKRSIVVLVLAVLLSACITPPTETPSPLPTLTVSPISPLPTPEARLDRIQETEKPKEVTPMLTAERLAEIVAIVMSLLFSYIPGFKGWFDPLSKAKKQAIMGLLLIAVSVGTFGLACAGVTDVVVCSDAGALGLVEVLIAALVANQAVYLITKK